jgi:two-component system chemotaxis sensor kinase CheA
MVKAKKTTKVSAKKTNPVVGEQKDLKNQLQKLQLQIQNLEQEKIMFHGLLDTIPDVIYFKDRKSRFLMVSKAGIAKFGVKDMDYLYGKTDFDIFTSEHAQDAYNDEQNIIATGTSIINKEEKETWEDGKITWCSSSKVPMRDPQKKITGIVGISRDITEKKEIEAKLNRYRENLELAKRETDMILTNLEGGLFLLDRDLVIASQHSAELNTIFEETDLANNNILVILQNKISDHALESTRSYLELLLEDDKDEEMFKDLNPLVEIPTTIRQKTKYLSYKFRRIKDRDNKTTGLIATVNDVTKEVNLVRSLEEEKAESKKKMDWMLCILNIDPSLLKDFVVSVEEEMTHVDDALKTLIQNQKQDDVLDGIYRSIHTIKGNASLLELNFLADQAHLAEDTVTILRKKIQIMREDKKKLSQEVEGIHKTYEELKNLIDQISKIHDQFRPKRSYEHQRLIDSLNRLIDSLSKQYNKSVTLDHTALVGDMIPYQYRLVIRDILVQFVRNSLYHGIEAIPDRKRSGKPEQGKITVAGKSEDSSFVLSFEDDGHGIDVNKLKKKILEAGRHSQAEINTMNSKELIEAVFMPGISTADSTDLTAGRGYGLDIVKQKIEKIGGKVSVDSKPNEFTRFIVTLPMATSSNTVSASA